MRHILSIRWLPIAMVALVPRADAGPKLTTDSPLAWVQPTLSTDPRFTALAHDSVAAGPLAAIEAVVPYSAAITNSGTVPIVGLAVRFNLVTGGQTVVRDYFYYGFKATDSPVLAPGQTRLYAPLSSANDILHGRPSRPFGSPADTSALRLLAAADEIHISIDLVLAVDGRMAGPDQGQHVAQILAQSQAFHAMVNEAAIRINAGTSDADLLSWLATFAANQGTDRYSSTIKRIAMEWTTLLKAGNRSTLTASVSMATTLPDRTQAFLNSLKRGLQ